MRNSLSQGKINTLMKTAGREEIKGRRRKEGGEKNRETEN